MKKPSDYKYYPKMIYFKTESKKDIFTKKFFNLKNHTGKEVEDLLIHGVELLNKAYNYGYDDKGNKI